MIRKLNLISYNNRDLIQIIWTNSNNRKYDYENDEEFIAEENKKKLNR